MAIAKEATEATAFFSAQISMCMFQIMLERGIYPLDLARLNVDETVDQGAAILGPEHHPFLVDAAKSFLEMIEKVQKASGM